MGGGTSRLEDGIIYTFHIVFLRVPPVFEYDNAKILWGPSWPLSCPDLFQAAAARRLSRWADDGERTKRWLASRGALARGLSAMGRTSGKVRIFYS